MNPSDVGRLGGNGGRNTIFGGYVLGGPEDEEQMGTLAFDEPAFLSDNITEVGDLANGEETSEVRGPSFDVGT